MRLKDRVALITGAGRGIGRAIALAYAKEGASLALAARTLSELEETAREAQALGALTQVVQVDVTNEEEVADMVRQTVERFSTIDVLVNNAGAVGPVGPIYETDVAEWVRTIQVNVVGMYLCCRAVIPLMLRNDRGKIINLGGAGATIAWRSTSAYSTSKAAVVRLTEGIAFELQGANVQANVLGPGSIHTRLWEELRDGAEAAGDSALFELGRRVTSGGGAPMDRAADLAVFLASDDSAQLSGRLISSVTEDLNALTPRIPEIMASDAYTVRRVELG